MKKPVALFVGAITGAAVGLAVNYLFGAASDTTFDEKYRSRWDRALQEGRRAAAEHELMLRQQLVTAKSSPPTLPVNDKYSS